MSYEQGFMDKCAQYGVDPEWLCKQAGLDDFLTSLRKAMGDVTGAAKKVEPMSPAAKTDVPVRPVKPSLEEGMSIEEALMEEPDAFDSDFLNEILRKAKERRGSQQ